MTVREEVRQRIEQDPEMIRLRQKIESGKATYADLCDKVKAHAEKRGVEVVIYQSNHEGELVDKIQEAYFEGADGIVINPGAYTHTSIALLDAVKATALPCVEVHISKLEEREDFRQISYVRLACTRTITGLGIDGYLLGIDHLIDGAKK